MSNIWADVLKKAGYKVTVEPSLGTRDIVVPAIEKGQIDLEPDYAASLLGYLENGKILPAAGRHRHRRPGRPEGARQLRRDGACPPPRRSTRTCSP